MIQDFDVLDARLLRLFAAIHASRSITRAGTDLGLAQPTVSIGLARLRRHFGDPLFVRGPDGMLPTPLAEALIGPVRDALQALRDLSGWRAGFDPATATRSFRIAMTDASHATLLPHLLAAVRRQAPGVVLEASRIDTDLPAALHSGAIDLALGYIPMLDGSFHDQILFDQDWICIARTGHPGLEAGLSRTVYEAHLHVGIIGGTGQRLLETALDSHGIARSVALRLPGILGLPAILASSDLIATLPRQIGETLAAIGGLAVHPCPFNIERFLVRQHWHARCHHDPASRWLRDLCARLFVVRHEPAPSARP